MASLLLIGASISYFVFSVGLFEVVVTFVAVMATFCHAQVSDRLREYADGGVKIPPECSHLERSYYYVKEASWLLLFLYLANLPALIGTAGFLVYPVWRSYYKGREEKKENNKEQ